MENQSESRLLYEVMRELGKFGAVYRTNSGNVRLPSGKMFRGMPKGFADCMLILPGGTACFIEAKIKPNKPTPEQIAFIEKMQGLNCKAGIAYSVEDALEICGLSQ
jgi:hypothetical protein